MRVVIALGGNALLERGEAPNSDIQETHVVSAVTALAPLAGHISCSSPTATGRRSACWPWNPPVIRRCRTPTPSTCSGRRPRG